MDRGRAQTFGEFVLHRLQHRLGGVPQQQRTITQTVIQKSVAIDIGDMHALGTVDHHRKRQLRGTRGRGYAIGKMVDRMGTVAFGLGKHMPVIDFKRLR